MSRTKRRTLPSPPAVISKEDNPCPLPESTKAGASLMSIRGSTLRILFIGTLLGILLLGDKFGWREDGYIEDHPVDFFFKILNIIFKKTGWLLTASCWALLLAARYNRQIRLQENASWRRHAIVDVFLWIGGSVYWAIIVNFAFHRVALQVGDCVLPDSIRIDFTLVECTSMNGKWIPFDISGHTFLCSLGTGILLEEMIRFIGEPVYYFTFYSMDSYINQAKLLWRLAVIAATCLVCAWMVLFIRTALFYHTFQEKIWGTIVGVAYWWFVVVFRVFSLYI